MASIDNTFLRGKMNKDVDDRLMPSGEYRDALNINISRSEGSDVGAAENILGNNIPYTGVLADENVTCIGSITDTRKDRIFWFIAGVEDVSLSAIYMYDTFTKQSPSIIASGRFLNFSSDYIITGVNILEDFLFWTDNYNQPRRLNISRALDPNFEYSTEAHISMSRFAPYEAISFADINGSTTMDYDTGITSSYMREEFPRFAYRFKFIDNEYSTISPFSPICFRPSNLSHAPKSTINTSDIQDAVATTELSLMLNWVNKVSLNIKLPSADIYSDYGIESLEILTKNAGEQDVKEIASIKCGPDSDFNDSIVTDSSENSLHYFHEYKSEPPYKVLPSKQLTRVFDNIPRRAKSQEVISNRVVYGNYLQNYEIPSLDFSAGFMDKSDELDQNLPTQSVKQRRLYKVGIVLVDKEGRHSPVILSEGSSVDVPYKLDQSTGWKGISLAFTLNDIIPEAYLDDQSVSLNNFSSTVSGDTLALSGYEESGNNFRLGDRLIGQNIPEVTITKITVDNILSTTSVLCDGDIHTTEYEFTSVVAPVNLPIIRFNKDGWHSYRIVVQQQDQEYYNVYTPPIIRYNLNPDRGTEIRNWVSLHGDNVNKVPRLTSNDVVSSGVSPSSILLYSKVSNRRSDVGPSPEDTNINDPIKVISIGTVDEHSLLDDSNPPAPLSWLYQAEKGHLVAEMPYDRDLGVEINSDGEVVEDESNGQAPPEPTDPQNPDDKTAGLGIFETEPFRSVLDIFWETSSTGLVRDLNNLVKNGEEGDSLGYPSLAGSTFSESDSAGTSLMQVEATNTTTNPLSFELLSVKNGKNEDVKANFSITEIPENSQDFFLVLTSNPFAFRWDSDYNTFNLSIKVTDTVTEASKTTSTSVLNLTNDDPVMDKIGGDTLAEGESWGHVVVPEGTPTDTYVTTVTAVNGAEDGASDETDLFYEFVNNPFDNFALDGVTGELTTRPPSVPPGNTTWVMDSQAATQYDQNGDWAGVRSNGVDDRIKIRVWDATIEGETTVWERRSDLKIATVEVPYDTTSYIPLYPLSSSSDPTIRWASGTGNWDLGTKSTDIGNSEVEVGEWTFDTSTQTVKYDTRDEYGSPNSGSKNGAIIASFTAYDENGEEVRTETSSNDELFKEIGSFKPDANEDLEYLVVASWDKNESMKLLAVYLARKEPV